MPGSTRGVDSADSPGGERVAPLSNRASARFPRRKGQMNPLVAFSSATLCVSGVGCCTSSSSLAVNQAHHRSGKQPPAAQGQAAPTRERAPARGSPLPRPCTGSLTLQQAGLTSPPAPQPRPLLSQQPQTAGEVENPSLAGFFAKDICAHPGEDSRPPVSLRAPSALGDWPWFSWHLACFKAATLACEAQRPLCTAHLGISADFHSKEKSGFNFSSSEAEQASEVAAEERGVCHRGGAAGPSGSQAGSRPVRAWTGSVCDPHKRGAGTVPTCAPLWKKL